MQGLVTIIGSVLYKYWKSKYIKDSLPFCNLSKHRNYSSSCYVIFPTTLIVSHSFSLFFTLVPDAFSGDQTGYT